MLSKKQMLGMTVDEIVKYFEKETATFTDPTTRIGLSIGIGSLVSAIERSPKLRIGKMKLGILIDMMVSTDEVNASIDRILSRYT